MRSCLGRAWFIHQARPNPSVAHANPMIAAIHAAIPGCRHGRRPRGRGGRARKSSRLTVHGAATGISHDAHFESVAIQVHEFQCAISRKLSSRNQSLNNPREMYW